MHPPLFQEVVGFRVVDVGAVLAVTVQVKKWVEFWLLHHVLPHRAAITYDLWAPRHARGGFFPLLAPYLPCNDSVDSALFLYSHQYQPLELILKVAAFLLKARLCADTVEPLPQRRLAR